MVDQNIQESGQNMKINFDLKILKSEIANLI